MWRVTRSTSRLQSSLLGEEEQEWGWYSWALFVFVGMWIRALPSAGVDLCGQLCVYCMCLLEIHASPNCYCWDLEALQHPCMNKQEYPWTSKSITFINLFHCFCWLMTGALIRLPRSKNVSASPWSCVHGKKDCKFLHGSGNLARSSSCLLILLDAASVICMNSGGSMSELVLSFVEVAIKLLCPPRAH